MQWPSPEGRGVLDRLRDALAHLALRACTTRTELDAATQLVLRRDRFLGLVLLRESAWRNGLRHGPEVWHSLRGDARSRREWREGIPHGPWREWHGNGVKALECFLENGVLNGACTAWRRSGGKRYVGTYRMGDKTGEWFYLKRDGALDREKTGLYVAGERLSGIKGFNEWLGSP